MRAGYSRRINIRLSCLQILILNLLS